MKNRFNSKSAPRSIRAVAAIAVACFVLPQAANSQEIASRSPLGGISLTDAVPLPPAIATAKKPLGFGWVEFDWEGEGTGGVPGFDSSLPSSAIVSTEFELEGCVGPHGCSD